MAAYRAALIYMLKKLFITDFRNINSAEIDLKPGLTLISGDNGQGKTNFLEALFMVSQGWSFRSRSHDDVINWDAKECMLRVQGEIAVISESEFEQGFLLRRRRGAEVRVDSQKSTNMGELHGRYGCVYMGPEDIALVRGAPELRRRWVDVLMSKSHPDGLDLLRKFRRILRQRTSWLKTSDQNFYGDEQWFALTDIFVQLWSQISQRRAQVLEDCIPLLNEFYAEISGGAEDINLSYINGTGLELAELVSIDLQELQQILLEKMEKLKAREQIMGLTMAGAHREDFALNFRIGSCNRKRLAIYAITRTSTQ